MSKRKSNYPSKEEVEKVLGNDIPEEYSFAEGMMMRARVEDLTPLQKRIKAIRRSTRPTHAVNVLINARG